MSMYEAYLQNDGTFKCRGMLQDGYEYWVCASVDEVVKTMKLFANFCNGDKKLKKKDIVFLKTYQVSESRWMEYKP